MAGLYKFRMWLSALGACLLILSGVVPDWLERIGINLDGGDGHAEIGVVAVIALTVIFVLPKRAIANRTA